MATEHPHLFLRDAQETEEFTTPQRGGAQNIPQRADRQKHSDKLQEQLAAIWAKAKEQEESRTAVSIPTKDGVYVEFQGAPGYDLVTKSLENRPAGIRLLNIYTVPDANDAEQKITRATVFIPTRKHEHFLKKLRKYAEEENKISGKPKHAVLVQSVEDMRLAVLESFWRDDDSLLPQGPTAVWCEIWLRGTEDEVEQSFRLTATELGIDMQQRSLRFPERTVLLGKATREQLVVHCASYDRFCLSRASWMPGGFAQM